MTRPVQLSAGINVGSLVQFKTGDTDRYVVVQIGRWWHRGQVLIRYRSQSGTFHSCWAYPAELELVEAAQ